MHYIGDRMRAASSTTTKKATTHCFPLPTNTTPLHNRMTWAVAVIMTYVLLTMPPITISAQAVITTPVVGATTDVVDEQVEVGGLVLDVSAMVLACLLYTSPSPRDS
eukprot:TRINITY_DN6727_c0_g1_i3.p1 TRINITY_DN6727_c0_g1~~TRINITY_DN6727_c0_g1_i3.p1  ORF type:complete len:107 (-),score=10.81 TRINITY_DN6727_c0_g1_i3:130-450(-)